MKEIIIVYCCRLPKQCVFIWFQIHYLHLHNTDAQAVLDTVHVTNFVQSHHCRWRTDSFTFVRVVSSIFFDFRRLSSDLR